MSALLEDRRSTLKCRRPSEKSRFPRSAMLRGLPWAKDSRRLGKERWAKDWRLATQARAMAPVPDGGYRRRMRAPEFTCGLRKSVMGLRLLLHLIAAVAARVLQGEALVPGRFATVRPARLARDVRRTGAIRANVLEQVTRALV